MVVLNTSLGSYAVDFFGAFAEKLLFIDFRKLVSFIVVLNGLLGSYTVCLFGPSVAKLFLGAS